MEMFTEYAIAASRFGIILLSVAILLRCVRSMLSEHYEPEIWGYIRQGDGLLPVYHWENLIGRSRACDARISAPGISRFHAVLSRDGKGRWVIYDIFSKNGVWVNGMKVGPSGTIVQNGDVINLAGTVLGFLDLTEQQRAVFDQHRTRAGQAVSPLTSLVELTVLQGFLMLSHYCTCGAEYRQDIFLGFAGLICLQWLCYNIMRLMDRSGFELEILAFYLCTLGMSVAASSTPEDMLKQFLLTLTGVALFLLSGWWMRSLRRAELTRGIVAVMALGLLAVNVLASDVVLGARNWLEIGGFSFQPSELVKAFYVYVGAATLDKLYRTRNLFSFIAFSAICVIALALIGDFGTALIFFVCFLVISYMRSGSIATTLLAISGAGLAGVLAITVKPYIAQRFASWGHVWEDVYDKGFQQTRAMSAAASGGLFGKGAGAGWLEDIFAANTDMVFAMICEEMGLIVGLCMVAAVLSMAFFALRSSRNGRSAYYAIAACAAVTMMMCQVALNVFGSLDILPFTGVTFPFVSRGGSSMLSCWLLISYIKSADTRKSASFAVSTGKRRRRRGDESEDYPDYEENAEERWYHEDEEAYISLERARRYSPSSRSVEAADDDKWYIDDGEEDDWP